MVARDDQERRIPDRRAELGEEGAGRFERRGQRAIAQLDGVSEQDDAVRALELGPQDPAKVGAAQQVGSAARSEVEVGENHRPHSGIVH